MDDRTDGGAIRSVGGCDYMYNEISGADGLAPKTILSLQRQHLYSKG